MAGTTLILEDLVLPGIITVMGGMHLATMARRIGKLRGKLKIPFPATTGDPLFERTFRAHQNSVEFFPIFMSVLWSAGVFFHPVPTFLAGAVYIYSREKYFRGYKKSNEDRLPGFLLGIKCLMVLLAMGSVGLLTSLLRRYAGIDIADNFFNCVRSSLPEQSDEL